jgi:hypothetical protein
MKKEIWLTELLNYHVTADVNVDITYNHCGYSLLYKPFLGSLGYMLPNHTLLGHQKYA